jgi:AraC-like DNA-binding protein
VISSVEISRVAFLEKLTCELETFDPRMRDLLSDATATKTFYYEGNYSLSIADIISDIEQFSYQGYLRKTYLESKALAMIVTQIADYLEEANAELQMPITWAQEIQRLREAQEIIVNELNRLPPIGRIARRVGLSEKRLQAGFKKLHGMTVNNYIREQRLMAAKQFLTKSDLNMSEIADRIGISSKSYFSKIFRERFNISPKTFRLKRQQAREDKD